MCFNLDVFPKKKLRDSTDQIKSLTSDVSHRSLLPWTRFPIVMWKYVFPELQFEIFVKGYVVKISCGQRKHNKYTKTTSLHMQTHSHTLFLGSIRLTPYLLMAIRRISGKFGSVVCCIDRIWCYVSCLKETLLCFTAVLWDCYLHFKESRSKRGPFENELQKHQLGFLSGFTSMPVEVRHNRLQNHWKQTHSVSIQLYKRRAGKTACVLKTNPLPVVWRQLPYQILRNKLF